MAGARGDPHPQRNAAASTVVRTGWSSSRAPPARAARRRTLADAGGPGREAAVTVDGPHGAKGLPCGGTYWEGGLQPAEVFADLGLPRTPTGWLSVGPTFQCFPAPSSHPDIFTFGDAVRVVDGTSEWPTVQRASECSPQAKVVARNIMLLAAEPPSYPNGAPPLVSYRLHSEAPYGVNIGGGGAARDRAAGAQCATIQHLGSPVTSHAVVSTAPPSPVKAIRHIRCRRISSVHARRFPQGAP
jgi:hypothetical protein